MKIKATPGPWVRNVYGDVCGPDGKQILVSQLGMSFAMSHHTEETKANAKLIAASPFLYEELEICASALAFLSNHLAGRMGEGALADMAQKAEDAFEALETARGEE